MSSLLANKLVSLFQETDCPCASLFVLLHVVGTESWGFPLFSSRSLYNEVRSTHAWLHFSSLSDPLSGSCRSTRTISWWRSMESRRLRNVKKSVDPRLVIHGHGSPFQCIRMALLRMSTAVTVTLKPYWVGELEAVWKALVTTRPLKISMLARKQGLNTLKSTAQWTWININGAQFYVQACQDTNMQAINCFSLTISVVLFDITGDYQLYHLYLTLLLLEQTYTGTNTPRIGAAVPEEQQVLYWTYIAAANPPIKDLCEGDLHKSCINSLVPSSFQLDELWEQQPAFKDQLQGGELCHKTVGGDPMALPSSLQDNWGALDPCIMTTGDHLFLLNHYRMAWLCQEKITVNHCKEGLCQSCTNTSCFWFYFSLSLQLFSVSCWTNHMSSSLHSKYDCKEANFVTRL